MKILFKNTTQYTKENYNAFIEFHRNKYGKRTLIKLGVMALCLLYILIINLIHFNWKMLFILLLTGVIVVIFNNITIKQKTTKNKRIVKSQKEFNFYFYEKYIKIKCGRKFERLRYFEVHKVFETKDYFFLYTDEDHSLILSKEGFEIGTAKKFTEFIKRKCLLKYRKEDK